MRLRAIVPSLAMVFTLGFSQVIAQQRGDTPQATSPFDDDRDALACPYLILELLQGFQKNCHPADDAFGKVLDEPIAELEKFFAEKHWADREYFDHAHRSFEIAKKTFEDEARGSAQGPAKNICDFDDLEQMYQWTRNNLEEMRRDLDMKVAHPPLATAPSASSCL